LNQQVKQSRGNAAVGGPASRRSIKIHLKEWQGGGGGGLRVAQEWVNCERGRPPMMVRIGKQNYRKRIKRCHRKENQTERKKAKAGRKEMAAIVEKKTNKLQPSEKKSKSIRREKGEKRHRLTGCVVRGKRKIGAEQRKKIPRPCL